jgi:iron complex outermembrane receptor protein
VGQYLDGVYIGKAEGSIFDINDLERIEVLRGPQGTLYGRNTIAGAINFVTRKPTNAFGSSLDVGYGNYNAVLVKGSLNLPVTDRLFTRISMTSDNRDGIVSLAPEPLGIFPTASGSMSGRNRQSALAQIRFLPTDHVTADYSFDYSRVDETAPAQHFLNVDPNGLLGRNCPFPPANCIPAYVYGKPNYSDTAYATVRGFDYSRVVGHALTLAWELGKVTLKSITGYRTMDYKDFPLSVDGTPLPLALGGYDTRYHQFSQEFQATGTIGQPFNYVAGLYYFHDNGFSYNPQTYFFQQHAVSNELRRYDACPRRLRSR